MNLQHNSEEPRQNYTSPVSEEREAAETLVPVCPERIRRICSGAPFEMVVDRFSEPLHIVANRFSKGLSLDEFHFETLLQNLQNPSATRWRRRMLASWVLGNAPFNEEKSLQAVTALGESVEKSHKQDGVGVLARFLLRSSLYFILTMVVIYCIDGLFGFDIHGMINRDNRFAMPYVNLWVEVIRRLNLEPLRYHSSAWGVLAYFLLCASLISSPISLPLSLLLDKKRQTRVRREATLSLAQLGRVEALPYLLSAIRGAKGELHTEMLNAIGELLPRLTSEDYGRFRSDTVPNLCHLLERCSGDYQLKALQALGAIGDSRAIPAVRRLAGVFAQDKSLYTSISKTAIEILPILEAREAQESHSRNLLRASQEPFAEKELLRPSYAVAETQPETLLRPSESPSQSE